MDISVAGLAAGVAHVKRELDGLDDQIRADLVACADIQTQLNKGADDLQRLAEEAERAAASAAHVQAEDADLQLLCSSLARQQAAIDDNKLQLEVCSPGWLLFAPRLGHGHAFRLATSLR